jgi:hypothetical protein
VVFSLDSTEKIFWHHLKSETDGEEISCEMIPEQLNLTDSYEERLNQPLEAKFLAEEHNMFLDRYFFLDKDNNLLLYDGLRRIDIKLGRNITIIKDNIGLSEIAEKNRVFISQNYTHIFIFDNSLWKVEVWFISSNKKVNIDLVSFKANETVKWIGIYEQTLLILTESGFMHFFSVDLQNSKNGKVKIITSINFMD